MDYTCPLCGEFDGSLEEVQAHISSKKDKAHKLKAGREVLSQPPRGHQSGQNGQQEERAGQAEGKQTELPAVACEGCGRRVKYPELMPYKMSCPECGRTMRKKKAAKETEKQADEPGNDETQGVKKT
jgi:predicted RNA-binding Zn-ribbon protein involved in translation (DUF1610 family)